MTEAELIEEVLKALETEDPDGFHTTKEFAKLLGVAIPTVRAKLHAIDDAGRLEVGTVTRLSLGRISAPVTAYRILPE